MQPLTKHAEQPAKPGHPKSGLPWGWIIGGLLLAAIVAAWFLLPLQSWLQAFSTWIKSLGVWGVLIFGLTYIVATVALAPGSPLSIAAGLVFGFWGFPIIVVSATVGAGLAFIVARYLARERVRRQIANRPKLVAVDKAVAEDGWKIVALLRLSPLVPFNLQNYGFGVTPVGFWPFLAATAIGIMPGTLLFVSIGAAGKASASGSGGTLKWVLFAVGLAATALVSVLIARKAKAKLAERGVDDAADSVG